MNKIDTLINSINGLKINPNVPFSINTTITKHLGLLDENGMGLQEVSVDLSNFNSAEWSIPALTEPIQVSNLIDDKGKPKDEIAFKFILIRLQIKPVRGETWETAIFDKRDFKEISTEIVSIDPILSIPKDDTSGYAVTAGTFSFHFLNKEKQRLGRKYNVLLKTNTEKDIINCVLEKIAENMSATELELADNMKLNFELGKLGPSQKTIDDGIEIKVNNAGRSGKMFNALNEKLPFFIKVKVKEVNINSKDRIWATGDTVVLEYYSAVKMNPETIIKL